MRRPPPAAWILAPLAVGLLYAAGHALLGPRPTLADLPPDDAVLVQRFRNLDAVDRCSFGPRGPSVRPAREVIGEERNLPGLPGVDPDGPLHMILMPRTLRLDATMAVFAVADEDALASTFDRPDFIERGLTRHAQELAILGSWAAVGPSRDAVRRLGTGGITAADLGEDHALAADVPRLIDQAAGLAREYPWRDLLVGLGIDVDAAVLEIDAASGLRTVHLPDAERLGRIRSAWATARLWIWSDARRLRADLETQPGPLREALGAWAARPEAGPAPAPPADAEAWLALPGPRAAALLAELLHHAGVPLPAGVPPLSLGATGAPPAPGPTDPGGLLLWAVPDPESGYAWSVGVAAPAGWLPDLAPFLPVPSADEASVPLPEGAAPFTKGDATVASPSPAGTVQQRRDVEGFDLLTFGASAPRALVDMRTHIRRGLPSAPPPPPPSDEGWAALASFALRGERATRILGRALEPGGFLNGLAGGAIEGALWTDGRTVRLEARVGGVP